MKIKIYHDKTYNIFYEIGDYVKIKHDKKLRSDDKPLWGQVTKINGKPLTAKLTIDTNKGIIDEYVWNIIPVTEDGTEITHEQLFKIIPVTESLFDLSDINDKKIIKFNEFN